MPKLYSLPIAGGVPVRLNPSADSEAEDLHLQFEISRDSRYFDYVENINGGPDTPESIQAV